MVDADDAAARGGLVAFRHEAERRGDGRHAVFARHLALATPEERFRAFHDELGDRPDSVVGPLGECLVYAGWSRMGPQASKACDVAATALGAHPPAQVFDGVVYTIDHGKNFGDSIGFL